MIRHYLQKCTDPARGDCFKTCVACVLDLDPDELPNFCFQGEGENWFWLFQEWLTENVQMTCIEVRIDEKQAHMGPVMQGVPCILSGKSPRGDWLHSVVGSTRGFKNGKFEGFEYHHDHNPDGDPQHMLDDLQMVMFFAPLRPDLVRLWLRK